jgi:hypothetical protein
MRIGEEKIQPLSSITPRNKENGILLTQKSWSVLKATAMAAAELCLELGPIPEEVVAVVEEAVGEAHSHVFQLAMAFH